MSNHLPTLLQFWKLRRKFIGKSCIIRPHHKIIARSLTRLILGQYDKPNLAILVPPRSSKTDLGVLAFVPWSMSYFPDSENIITSYGADLATSHAKSIRSDLTSEWYRQIISKEWGATVEMSGEKASGHQDFFHTVEGGSVKAVGRGGGITGFGAGKLRPEWGGCILIDDLLKAQEGKSPAARKDAVEYINGTLKSRRNRLANPKTPMVLFQQRLHPQDPAGYLLGNERDEWNIVQIAWCDEEGNSIWPERYGPEEMALMKEADPETYQAQYMQSPELSTNVILRPDSWKFWKDLAALERNITFKFITGDTAFKAKDDNDWSVFQCWGCEGTSGLHLIDQVRGRWEFPELLREAKNFWLKHSTPRRGYTPATKFWIEDKASGISLIQMMRTDAAIPVIPWTPDESKTSPDKVGRAKQAAFPLVAGRVFIPEFKYLGLNYRWVEGFINECAAFTSDDSHLYDDQVDNYTMAAAIWKECGGGSGPLPRVDS